MSERIVTAWAEHCSGSGWANQVVWVLLHDPTRTPEYRVEALQPDEQSAELQFLFNVSASVSESVRGAAERCLHVQRSKGVRP